MNTFPTSQLEERARDQRSRLSDSIAELRTQVREKLEPGRAVRNHMGTAATLATVLGLLAGYALAGIFTRR